MNFVSILEELERLIVSLFLWIVFIPKTLYKIITRPTWVPGYITAEFKRDTKKFDDFISPIILFFISTVCMLLLQENLPDSGNHIEILPDLSSKKTDDFMTTLSGYKVFLTGLLFLSIPFLFSLIIELFRVKKLTRDGLRRGFYIQCFYFSPLALFFMIIIISLWLIKAENDMALFANSLFLGIFVWFGAVQIRFISRELKRGLLLAALIFIVLIIVVIIAIYIVTINKEDILSGKFFNAPLGYVLLALMALICLIGIKNLVVKKRLTSK